MQTTSKIFVLCLVLVLVSGCDKLENAYTDFQRSNQPDLPISVSFRESWITGAGNDR